MKPPDPRELFAYYHLGLDRRGRHAFRNLADLAREYGTDRDTASQWLKSSGLDPDTVGTVDYNLSALHVDAMLLVADRVEQDRVDSFVAEAWKGYVEALSDAVPGTFHFDIDYDEL